MHAVKEHKVRDFQGGVTEFVPLHAEELYSALEIIAQSLCRDALYFEGALAGLPQAP